METCLKNKRATKRLDRLASAYLDAKEIVIKAGYADEVDWQGDADFDSITEITFLREAAWVILSSGFREAIVRRIFPRVSAAFFDWQSSELIVQHLNHCRVAALEAFANRQKINAIGAVAVRVAESGIDVIKKNIHLRGIEYLEEFPFIGPVTAYHLAKNIGLPVAKPDRHLVRISASIGYECPNELCRIVANYISEPVSVVDLVLWRYFTITAMSPFKSTRPVHNGSRK